MTDNFDKIIPLLSFKEGYFYFVQILQRKKDHKGDGKVNGTNNNSRLIKAYYIDSQDKLEFVKPEIIELCKLFNARAGINLNRRSYEKMAFQQLKKITDQILNKEFAKAHRAYNAVCGSYSHDTDKSWIIDIDGSDEHQQSNDMIAFINKSCFPEGAKYLATIPSRSGYHIITRPFDMHKFKTVYPSIDVHKNNPTNLYIP